MKIPVVIAIALLSAAGSYLTYFRCATAPTQAMLSTPNGGMQWLRGEYHLSDAQFARIQELHRQYAPQCDRMCARINEANTRLDALIAKNKTYTPEVAAALKECQVVQGECRQALLEHVYAVSAEMPPADGARYVEMMKSRIVEPGLTHSAVISASSK